MKIAQELRAGSTIKIGNDPFVVLRLNITNQEEMLLLLSLK